MSCKVPGNQMARWVEALSQYDFKLEHRKRSKHANAEFCQGYHVTLVRVAVKLVTLFLLNSMSRL